ncbi:MAG: SGNH/GDSL hydrolase family protein [Propionibacteriaceae bacterium]|nr:SGNH/GDSL hydrolase family protein [Propionibacteriaceae bacterium]
MSHPWRRYVALGDSLSEGLQDLAADGAPRGWADRLAQGLADRCGEDVRYANLAIRGRLLRPILDEQLEPALALQPDLVSLWGGGNDLLRPDADPDAMAAVLEEAVVTLRASGADVLIGLGVDPKDSPVIKLTRNRVAVYNLNLATLADRHGAHLVNTWGMRSLRDWRMWDADRLHLNSEGHRRVSQAALVGLGLDPDSPDWDTPLPPATPLSRREAMDWNRIWVRDHLAPWIGRRFRRTSSGHGRAPKQATYRLVSPGGGDPAGPRQQAQ